MNSFIAWVGGKRQLSKEIVSHFPDHKVYVEVFGGAAWVLFKKEPSQIEVYNDINSWLVNLFLVVKEKPHEFINGQKLLLPSREIYYKYKDKFKNNSFDNDIDKAIIFYYLIKNAFGASPAAGWGYAKTSKPRYRPNLEKILEVSDRLKTVYIENQSYEKLIEVWDSPETLFYCDPPYVVCKKGKYYSHQFSREDEHYKLKDTLSNIKGKFLLSYDNDPLIKDLYKGFNIELTKAINYSLRTTSKRKHKREVFITNY